MSEQEINEAIAEACGRERNPDGGWYPDNGLRVGTQAIPDYCGDLNAMHEAEKVINQQCKHGNYWFFVRQICDFPDAESDWDRFEFFSAIHATARQRAEAFLRALGKWEPVVKECFTTEADHLRDGTKMVGEVQP